MDDRDLIPLQKDGELFAQRREGAGLDLEDGTVARPRVGDKAAHADFLRVHVRLVKALEHGMHAFLAHDAHASGTFEKLIILAQEAEALLPLRERAGSLHGKTPASAVRPIRSCRASLSGPEHRVCLGGNPAARRLDPMARARLSHGRGSVFQYSLIEKPASSVTSRPRKAGGVKASAASTVGNSTSA